MSMPHSGGPWQIELVAVGSPARFKALTVANKGAVDFWAWVCDSSTSGAITPTIPPLFVPAGTTMALDYSQIPRDMINGIYVCATTDPATKTLIASNDAFFDVAYENN